MKYPDEKINYLKKFGINAEWSQGVNGKLEKTGILESMKSFLPDNVIGCALAHLKVWKEFLLTDLEQIVIFEDDVILVDDFVDKFNILLRHKPQDTDLLYLGYFGDTPTINFLSRCSSRIPDSNNNDIVRIPSVVFATHAYLVTKQGATKLVRFLDGQINTHIDLCLNRLASQKKIRVYASNPKIAFQTSTYNTVSLNTSSNQPYLLNKILSNLEIDEFVNANYLINVSFLKIGNQNINTGNILFLVFGILFSHVSLKYAHLIFLLLVGNDIGNISTTMTNYILFFIPFIFQRVVKNEKNKRA